MEFMKKLSVMLICVLAVFGVYSQEGPYAGGNFSYNSTWLMNKQVFDHGAEMDPAVTFDYYYGFILGYNFAEEFGLEIGLNINNISQKYEGKFGENRYVSNTHLKTTDIPILAKIGSKSYFEIGPVFQFINAATYSRTFDYPGLPTLYKNIPYVPTNVGEADVVNVFADKMLFAAALGFGTNIELVDYKLFMQVGFRFQYTITDMEGVNGLNQTKNSLYVPGVEKENFKNNALVGGLRFGLTYYFL